MTDKKLAIFSRIFFSAFGLFLILFIVYKNVQPFGITLHYRSDNDKDISPLNPASRVEKIMDEGKSVTKQINDLIYFSVKFPPRVESGKVRIKFKNPYPDQEIYLGFQDTDTWHYDKKLIDAPLINSLGWPSVGTDPVLYQRSKSYESVADFLKNPPADSVVGFYKYDKDLLLKKTKLDGYAPRKENTVFDLPLRGQHTFYVYNENEMFKMKILLQDLNWYDGPDVTTIRIYKEKVLVKETIVDDDTIEDGSDKVLPEREVNIENPGPGLPESGIYKVVIDAPSDIIIKKITTNMHKMVFEGPLFLAGNAKAYPAVIKETVPSHLYSSAKSLSAFALHSQGLQTLKVGAQKLKVTDTKTEVSLDPFEKRYDITVPQNDIILSARLGYFAASEDNFFEPSIYSLTPITSSSDIAIADYIFAPYFPVQKVGDWHTADIDFDLKTAVAKKSKLSFIILAPNLKDNDRTLLFDTIDVDLYKKPLFKWK